MNLLAEVTEGFHGSMAALRAHRLRFFLSTLGIVVGISTVTLMGGAVEGIRQVDNQLRSAATAGSRYRREG